MLSKLYLASVLLLLRYFLKFSWWSRCKLWWSVGRCCSLSFNERKCFIL